MMMRMMITTATSIRKRENESKWKERINITHIYIYIFTGYKIFIKLLSKCKIYTHAHTFYYLLQRTHMYEIKFLVRVQRCLC
jgi:hypothetical protein